jgi:hypothetical protein
MKAKYTPFIDHLLVGYRVDYPDGTFTHLYFNPSDVEDDESDIPNVFVYEGPHREPEDDTPLCYFDL